MGNFDISQAGINANYNMVRVLALSTSFRVDAIKFFFISSHFFGKKDAEYFALRDQELCVAAHLFAEEINTESDLVGENLATKGDELYFQDLPIYNKLISLQQRWGKKPPPTKTRKRNTLGINSQAGGRGGGGKC